MTRPFTGQRKPASPRVASCLAFGGSGFASAGVTTFTAVGGDAAAMGADATFCVAGAAAWGALRLRAADRGCCACACGCAVLAQAACGATLLLPRRPGMTMRSPTFTRVDGGMLLARAISTSGLLYWRDSFISVSPGSMMWTCGPVAAGAVRRQARRSRACGAAARSRARREPCCRSPRISGSPAAGRAAGSTPFGRLLASRDGGRPARHSGATMESMVSPCCTVIAVPPCQFQPDLLVALSRAGDVRAAAFLRMIRRHAGRTARRAAGDGPRRRGRSGRRRQRLAAARSTGAAAGPCRSLPADAARRPAALPAERIGFKAVGVGAAACRGRRNRGEQGETEQTERAAWLGDATHRFSHSYATHKRAVNTARVNKLLKTL